MTSQTLDQQMEVEYMGSLYRAFVVGRADFIIVDGSSTEFIRNATAFALDKKLIAYDKQTSDARSDSQYTALVYRLTPNGKKEIQKLNPEKRK